MHKAETRAAKMNELLLGFNLLCSSVNLNIDTRACTGALEAYAVHSGLTNTVTDLRNILRKKALEVTKITPLEGTLLYLGGRYAFTKKANVVFPVTRNSALNLSTSMRDKQGHISLTLHW